MVSSLCAATQDPGWRGETAPRTALLVAEPINAEMALGQNVEAHVAVWECSEIAILRDHGDAGRRSKRPRSKAT